MKCGQKEMKKKNRKRNKNKGNQTDMVVLFKEKLCRVKLTSEPQ